MATARRLVVTSLILLCNADVTDCDDDVADAADDSRAVGCD